MIMKKTILLVVLMFGLFLNFAKAQKEKVVGLWEVKSVSVGDKIKTPVAKWMDINEGGNYKSGNGWLQSSVGSWKYDEVKNEFFTFDSLGIFDSFGGFVVRFESDKMIWNRVEEGMNVEVVLKPIEKLPMSPSDFLLGLWEIESSDTIVNHELGIGQKIYLNWEREYTLFSTEGKRTKGFWHLNGHQPILTLISRKGTFSVFQIEVDDKFLKLVGLSSENNGIIYRYKRKNNF